MEVIAGDRCTGKTTKLAQWVLEDIKKHAIVVRHRDQKERIINEFAIPKTNVFDISDIKYGHHRGNSWYYAIDDAEYVLAQVTELTGRIAYIAITANTILYREEETTVEFYEERTKLANYNG